MKSSEETYGIEDAWIETSSGRYFSLGSPDFNTVDIAHALANNCRYNGHCANFYSVAEHSVLVSKIMEENDLGNPLEGLLHDATEAYLTDVPAPFKQHLPDWRRVDSELDAKLRAYYRIGRKTDGCKLADWLALFIEAKVLLPDEGERMRDPECARQTALRMVPFYPIQCLVPAEAKQAFLNRYIKIAQCKRWAGRG